VRSRYTALADAAGHAATPQIRNVATLGGNLVQRPRCWYFRNDQFHCFKKGGNKCFAQEGENEYHAIFGNRICAIVHPSATGAALMALGARLEITGKKGKRDLPVENFWVTPEQDISRENVLAPDEMITAVHIPAPAANARSAYMKLGEKESFDWPLSEVAVVIEQNGGNVSRAAIILGAAAPVPLRARAAEAALTGKPLNEQTATAAATAAMQGATPLANNAYKVPIFATMIRRTILAAARA
jgi:xanthine dehydrogenase YagS FAD-binding subunit